MLDTFKARLKAKSQALGANLSQKRIDAIADRLHKKFPDLTDEADHDAKLSDYYDDDDLKGIAKDDDRLRTLENKGQKSEPPKTEPAKSTEPPTDEPPAWFKSYAEKVDRMEAEKQVTTIKQKLANHPKLKNIKPEFYDEWNLPQKEDELDAFADKVETKHNAFVQQQANEGFAQSTRPGSGNGTPPPKGGVSPEVKAFAEKNLKTVTK